MKNLLKEKLMNGNYALGGFLSIGSPAIVEVVAIGGLDFVVIDTEHGEPNFESIINMCRTAEAHGITALARVTDYDHKLIGRYLDNGMHGIQVPMVETAEMAQKVVSSAKYPPLGNRGMSLGRSSKWGHVSDYFNTANHEQMTVCMCETKLGIDNIEEIVRTPNLDVVFVGTGDLSLSMGYPGQIDHPEVSEAIDHVLRACKNSGVIPGIVTNGLDAAIKRIEQGFLYVTIFNVMNLLCKETEKITGKIHGSITMAGGAK